MKIRSERIAILKEGEPEAVRQVVGEAGFFAWVHLLCSKVLDDVVPQEMLEKLDVAGLIKIYSETIEVKRPKAHKQKTIKNTETDNEDWNWIKARELWRKAYRHFTSAEYIQNISQDRKALEKLVKFHNRDDFIQLLKLFFSQDKLYWGRADPTSLLSQANRLRARS